MNYTILIIDLFITIFVYLLVPMILVVFEKRFKLSTLKKIIIINAITSFVFFLIVKSLLGYDEIPNMKATLLWSLVGYFILKKKCLYNDEDIINSNQSQEFTKQIRRNKNFVPIILLSLTLICSIFLNIYQHIQIDSIKDECNLLRKEVDKEPDYLFPEDYEQLQNFKAKNFEKLNFYDANIVFVIDGYGDYYYTYDQMEQVTQDLDEYSYFAYNKESAIYHGYKAWK
jgi:amino acid transporter